MDVRGRMGVRYEDTLARHARDEDPGDELVGHSGYFTRPGASLDPRLFEPDSTHLKPAVRQRILSLLYDFWGPKYVAPRSWSTVWIAGSGISYQWNAERGGVGDLDVLIGVDHTKFLRLNPDFSGLPEEMIDQHFNKEFYTQLQPATAEYSFYRGQDPFEITFYVNPHATDIRNINPYAAYDVTHDRWTVKPPALPEDWDPFSYFPGDWWDHARKQMDEGRRLVEQYRTAAGAVGQLDPRSPAWVNSTTRLKRATEAAVDFFEDVHKGRRGAFGPGGKGYYGLENVLWQYGKLTGVIDALRKIKSTRDAAAKDANRALYGDASLTAEDGVIKASLVATKYAET
jgi:hypothetical protein